MRSSPLPRMSRRGRVTVGVLAGVFLLFTLFGWGDRRVDRLAVVRRGQLHQVFSGVLVTRLMLFAIVGVGDGADRRRQPLPGLPAAPAAAPALGRAGHAGALPDAPDRPRIGTWITAARRPDRPLRRPVRAGPLAAVDAVPPTAARSASRTRSSAWTSASTSSSTRSGGTCSGVGFTAVVLSVLGALAVHYLFGGVRLQGVGDRMTNAARAHLTTLVAVFVAAEGGGVLLDRRALLLGVQREREAVRRRLHRHQRAAAGQGDPRLDLDRGGDRDHRVLQRVDAQPGLAGHLAGPAGHLGGGDRRHLPVGRADLQVKPSAEDKEAPYIQRSIDATRSAFGLADDEDARAYAAATSPHRPTWPPTRRVVPNIRLLDPQLVSETYTQLQQVRGFYDFGAKLDIDRYTVDGQDPGLRGRRTRDQLRRADRPAEQLA